MKHGKFIVIEGADGVGSTTQSKMFVDFLNSSGTPAIFTAEPSGLDIGKMARSLLKSGSGVKQEVLALLFAADRLDHYYSEILPALQNGVTVVSDRYVLSSFVYQSLSLPIDWIKEINKNAPAPDVTFLVTLPFDLAWERICSRTAAGASQKEIFDDRDTQETIHRLYQDLLKEVSGISIDGTGTAQEVSSLLIKTWLSRQ